MEKNLRIHSQKASVIIYSSCPARLHIAYPFHASHVVISTMTHYPHSVSRKPSFVSREPKHRTPMGAVAALNANESPTRKSVAKTFEKKKAMYKIQRCLEEEGLPPARVSCASRVTV